MRKPGIRLVYAMLVLAILFSCGFVFAETQEATDGWLSITVGDERSGFNPEGTRIAIYLLATGDYGNWEMTENFSDITVFTRDDGSASVDITLGQIRRRIDDRKLKPVEEAVCDEKGRIEFKNLSHGIYYAEMIAGPDRLKMSPMLLSIPSKSGNPQVRAVAKYEYETPTPSPTPPPKPTLTPFVPPVTPPSDNTPAPPTREPEPTPTNSPKPDTTPVPPHVPTLPPGPQESIIPLEDYEAALGLGNIQMHVGVCYE